MWAVTGNFRFFAVYKGWNTTQLCRDFFIRHEIWISSFSPTRVSWYGRYGCWNRGYRFAVAEFWRSGSPLYVAAPNLFVEFVEFSQVLLRFRVYLNTQFIPRNSREAHTLYGFISQVWIYPAPSMDSSPIPQSLKGICSFAQQQTLEL